MRRLLALPLLAAALVPSTAAASPRCTSARWVTAFLGVPSDASHGTDISDIFGPSGDIKQPVRDSTVRAVFNPTYGGPAVRVHLSNRFGTAAVTFAHVTIARQGASAALTGRVAALRFRGKSSVTVPAGRDVVSDPARFWNRRFQNLAVSVFVSSDAGLPTEHYTARQTSYATPAGTGDHTADTSAAAFTQHITSRAFVTALDVRAPARVGTVVTLGDSITDGFQGQAPAGIPETKEGIDANGRWPDVFARRIAAARLPFAVANAGISGNRVLRDGITGGGRDTYGPSALKRLDADVLRQQRVTTVILLEGINDIGQNPGATPAEIEAGYRRIITRLHRAHLRVVQGTLTPSGGAMNGGNYGDAAANAKRTAVNAWIRSRSPADAIVDFDRAVRDPSDPSRIAPAYDGGDHLHFNLAGYRRMGGAVKLALLRRAACTRR